MQKETKVILGLAAATLGVSIGGFVAINATNSVNTLDFSRVTDFYYANSAQYFVFGNSTTTISFEGAEDKVMYEYLHKAKSKLDYLDRLGSTTKTFSDITNIKAINDTPVDQRVEINHELHHILSEGKFLYDNTNGIFDINAGKLFDYLNESFEQENGGAPLNVTPYLTNGKWSTFDSALLLEKVDDKYYATRKHNDAKIDLGGYLKGYSAEYLKQHVPDGKNILINSGSSSISYKGSKEKTITIGYPREGRKPTGENCYDWNGTCNFKYPGKWNESNDFHISSSGDYNIYYMDNANKRWHHLVNPITGEMKQDVGMLSVWSKNNTPYLDALSTTLFIADPSDYSTILGNFPNADIDVVYLEVAPLDNQPVPIIDVTYLPSNPSVINFTKNPYYI